MSLGPGSLLGPYEILSRAGAGGMGEVWKARDTRLDRTVAVKVLPPDLIGDPAARQRFDREARAVAALSHPHICTLFDIGRQDGIAFLVMEFVEGETLAQRLSRGKLALRQGLEYGIHIADALAAAHRAGIVHRDLKPGNIKLHPDGAKVLDFGLAKTVPSAAGGDASTVASGLTQDGVLLGTVGYMSPEQARGEPVDKRTDIWAFGCVLFEMLAGRPVFRGHTISETLAGVIERQPAWEQLPESTPPSARRLLRRCLEKNPDRRLHDLADARLEIEDAFEETVARAATPPPRAVRLWRTVALVACAVAAAAVLVLGIGSRRETSPSVVPRAAAVAAVRLTQYGTTGSHTAIAPDGRSFVFISDHGGTPDIWARQIAGGEPLRLTHDDAEEAHPVYSSDAESVYFTRVERGETSVWRIGVLGGTPQRVFTNARAPAPSPDGGTIAYLVPAPETDGLALVISPTTGGGAEVIAHGVAAVPPRWSPDGASLTYVKAPFFAPRNLVLVDLATRAQRNVTRFSRSEEGVTSHAWLPDNRHVAVTFVPPQAAGQQDLAFVDTESGLLSRLTYNVDEAFGGISLSADGSRAIVSALRHRHSLWEVPFGPDPDENGRRAVRLLEDRHDSAYSFVGRDGRILFTSIATGSRNLWLMPSDGSSPRQVTTIPGNAVQHGSLSPDGSQVAFGSRAHGSHDIWVQNVDGSALRPLTNDPSPDSWPLWSPDGRTIVFNRLSGERNETWQVPAAGGTPERLDAGFFRGDWINQPDGSGTWLVSWKPGRIRLLDVERRTTVWEQVLPQAAGTPTFSPDGQSVAMTVPESRNHQAIWIYDAHTGRPRRLAVRMPPGFAVEFRANWRPSGNAFVVTRAENISDVVLFDSLDEVRPRH